MNENLTKPIPLTPKDLDELTEYYTEALPAFDIMEEEIDPETPEGRRVYAWLAEQGVYSDLEFLWNWASLYKTAKKQWQDKTG